MAYNVNSVFEGPGLEGVIAVERINLNKCKDSAQAAAIAMRGLGKKFQERADAGQVVSMVANVGAGSAGSSFGQNRQLVAADRFSNFR